MIKFTKEQRDGFKENRERILSDFCNAQNSNRANYIRRLPLSYRWFFYNIFNVKNTGKTAIKGKCLDCSNFDKNEITNCNVESCALWNLRPYQSKK